MNIIASIWIIIALGFAWNVLKSLNSIE